MTQGAKQSMSPAAPRDKAYEQSRAMLEQGSEKDQLKLARAGGTRPEILYYLASDGSPKVRREVAGNTKTPIQADELLVEDGDDDVRAELARKITRLLPDLSEADTGKLRDRTLAVLDRLASDSLPKVRAIISEELKDSRLLPHKTVLKLAADMEDMVRCPVLQYSPLLGDDDLRELIAAGASEAALVAIARRPTVSEDVAADVAATLEIPAVSALLTNENAQIREDTLDQIIEQAAGVEALHRPLVMRADLSIRAMKRITGFVASALIHTMIDRQALPEKAAEELLDRVRSRIDNETVDEDEDKKLAAKARDYQHRGMLTDDFVVEAIDANRRTLLLHSLAVMADLPVDVVRQIINARSGRAVTALAWKAGLAMRTAFDLQTKLALVSPSQLVPARNGVDYPMDDNELVWHLSYFTD